MRDFLATLKPEEKPSEVFAQMEEAMRLKEEESRLTLLQIPPRLSALTEITTAQQTSSATYAPAALPLLEDTCTEDATSISPIVADPSHAEEFEYTVEEVMEGAEKVEEWGKAGKSLEEAIPTMGNVLVDTTTAELNMDGGERVGERLDIVTDTEGKIPVDIIEGEIPADVVEVETSEDVVEGENPGKPVEGATPEIAEEPTSGGLQDIVDLVNEPEGEETPKEERLIKRHTRRRSILDEVDDQAGLEELTMGNQGEGADTEKRRLAVERKRKG